MRWFVQIDGKSEGPAETETIRRNVAKGKLGSKSLVCVEGEEEWRELRTFPEFREALAGAAPSGREVPVARTRRGMPWAAITAVASVLTAGAVGTVLYLQVRTHDALLLRIDNVTRHVDGVLTEIRDANAPAPWAPSAQVHHNCLSDRSDVTCTFTNLSEKPVNTCTRGLLVQKAAPGVKLESLILCTGKLYPGETRVVAGPWSGGFADDICFKQNDFGKTLDWSKCEFDTGPVDLPTLRRVDAAAAAAK